MYVNVEISMDSILTLLDVYELGKTGQGVDTYLGL